MTEEAFLERYCTGLNPQQLEAVRSVEGAVLLLAVPGSGKTTVLVTRLGYMVCCCAIPPERILTMTYTVSATREMGARFSAMFGSAYGSRMEIRTINGIAQKIIDVYSRTENREAFQIQEEEGELNALIREIYREYYVEIPTDSTIRDIRTAITYCKNSMFTPEQIQEYDIGVKHFPEIYEKYCQRLVQNRQMDFDDQLLYAWNILKKRPGILRYFQEQYTYLCVDESQDTSKLQHAIIALLGEKSGNLFLVGDEDQSIYGFRAAYPEGLTQFEKRAKVLVMEENYRSTEEIIRMANGFVAKNQFRHPKVIHPTCGSGEPIHFIPARNRAAQYRYLCGLAQRGEQEFTVLFRNNDSAVPLIDYFERNGILYNCRRFEEVFFSHRIIADLTDIIRFAEHPLDAERFLRIYYKFSATISRNGALYACQKSAESGKPILLELIRCPDLTCSAGAVTDLYEAMQSLPGDTALDGLNRIRYSMGYGTFVEKNKLDAGKFTILEMVARQEASPAALLDRLELLRACIRDHVYAPDAKVQLSTIHSSKGLEFDRVYLLDFYDGILPVRRESELEPSAREALREYQEERRLCYVALTRAKRELNLFRPADGTSQFLEELESGETPEGFEGEDFLSFLGTRSLGQRYHHKDLGAGRITAFREEHCLIEFPGEGFRLMTLDEMLRERRIKPRQQTTPPPAPKKPVFSTAITEGTNVIHSHYGSGTVTAMDLDMITVRFSQDEKNRTFLKSAVLPNGKLKAVQ